MSKDTAIQLDEQDPLKAYRNEFYVKEGQYYLDGNSLGLMSKRAEKKVLSLLESWKEYGIDGWTEGEHPWYYFSEKLGEMCAPLVGAKMEEVILTGSTTTNLHQLLATFYKPEGKKVKILADELNFPTDLYAITSHLAIHGHDASYMKLVKSEDGHLLKEEAIIEAMTEDVALVILPGVLYRSGQVLDLAKLTKAAHARGILIGFDLCHSIGSIPHQLHEIGADFAFWCNYKHLNGGPGSVAGIFVHEKHFGTRPGLAGWFGSDKSKQFDLTTEMTPANTAGAYQIGTPHILSLAPIYGSLEIFHEAGIEAIRKKSLRLTQFFIDLIDQELAAFGFTLGSPKDETRGGHIYLVHEEAARICKALKEAGVTPDFRAPNGIRLAPVALYNSFTDVWETVQILKSIMENETYKKFENKRGVIA
ncbi:kynureninase [Lysinibacillus sp. 3P01SB]|uniref:kynureninase n=1 Tax=Lysinibacillus sp. 3P01SB TaxID=3132284 RepID=UPI0039A683A2